MVLPQLPQTCHGLIARRRSARRASALLLGAVLLAVTACRSAAPPLDERESAVAPTGQEPVVTAVQVRSAVPEILDHDRPELVLEVEQAALGTVLGTSVALLITYTDIEYPTFTVRHRVEARIEDQIPHTSRRLVRVLLPVDGLINEHTVRLDVHPAHAPSELWHSQVFRPALVLESITPLYPADGADRFDRRPVFAWNTAHAGDIELALLDRADADAHPLERVAQYRAAARAVAISLGAPADGEALVWWLRVVSERGVRGAWVPGGEVVLGTAPAPIAAVGSELVSPAVRAVMRWSSVPGAVEYDAETAVGDQPAQTMPTRNTYAVVDPALLEAQSIADGIRWRVRARNRFGDFTAWSSWFSFEHRPLAPSMRTIVSSGERAVARLLGAEFAVERAFSMARFELTTDVVSSMVNLGLRAGVIELDAAGVRELSTGRLLIGVGELTSGTQFGLEVTDGQLRVVDGYQGHPAVGVTWYGAVAIANGLSWLEGYARTYQGSYPRPLDAPGYRLPTEAEWTVAAAAGYPATVNADRAHATRINYFRSGDMFEDPVAPYTRNGGPTTPVGFLNNAGRHGVFDLVGNVWEWCYDWFDTDPRPYLSGAVNPRGPVQGAPDVYGDRGRVVRGAGWNTRVEQVSAGARGWFPPDQASFSIGVRLVRNDAPRETER